MPVRKGHTYDAQWAYSLLAAASPLGSSRGSAAGKFCVEALIEPEALL